MSKDTANEILELMNNLINLQKDYEQLLMSHTELEKDCDRAHIQLVRSNGKIRRLERALEVLFKELQLED